MTNNDDLGSDNAGLDVPGEDSVFDDFESAKEGGANILSGPMAKIGIGVAAVAAIVAVLILFGGEEKKAGLSQVQPGEQVAATPGTGELSPAMKEALEQRNEQEAETAARTGGSAMPIQVDAPEDRLTLPEEGQQEEDPLERWRKIQEERQRREAATRKPEAPPPDPNAPAIDSLSKAMNQQMQTVLETLVPVPPEYVSVAPADYLEEQREAERNKMKEEIAAATAAAGRPPITLDIIQPAGTIEYAQLITEANSDAPGPVLAEIASGPLAGSRILGSFDVQEDYLTLSFDTVVLDGVSYGASAVALDPSTANPGIVTEIDQRYFSRVILPAAAAFIEGMGSAIAESGTTVTVSDGAVGTETPEPDTEAEIYKGVEEAASKLGEIVDDEAGDIKPLIKVHAGTPIAILFLLPVTKDPAAN